MANPGYVRSTDGDNADTGATWALANATLTGAITDAAAGDTIWSSQVHAESTAATVTLTFPGTLASPNKVLCGNDAAEPPTALATTATVSTGAGAYNLVVNGCAYIYGIGFYAGVGSSSSTIGLKLNNSAGKHQCYESCHLECSNTAASGTFYVGYNGGGSIEQGYTEWRNTTVEFNNAAQAIISWSELRWVGGSITLGTAPTSLFKPGGDDATGYKHGNVLVENVDLSNMGSYLVDIANIGPVTYTFRNCKLKAGWAAITGTDPGPGWSVIIENCSVDDTSLPIVSQYHDYYGSVVQETTIKVTTGGASDGTNTYSWKMTCDADCEYPLGYLATPEMAVWNTTVGSAVTLTVEINHDSQGSGTSGKMTDKDMALEVVYLGTTGTPQGKTLTDLAGASTSAPWGTFVATSADQTDSAVAWSGTITAPEPQKLSVTVTPQEIGYIQCRVVCYKASAVVYVDPKITVS